MSKADMEAAVQALDPNAQHKDMVRDVGYNGVKEIQVRTGATDSSRCSAERSRQLGWLTPRHRLTGVRAHAQEGLP